MYYKLICILYALLCGQNFILVKSGGYSQASDLYALDTDTWTATSSVQSSSKEPAVSSHSPFGSRSR
jgi:hypothetical protein